MFAETGLTASRIAPNLPLHAFLALGLCIATSACAAQDDSERAQEETTAPAAPAAQEAAPVPAPSSTQPLDTPAATPAAAVDTGPVDIAAPTGAGGWRYEPRASSSGSQVPRAAITSRSGQETLVFEHHPVSGRDAILELPAAPGCEMGCKVTWHVDGGATTEVPASRPPSNPAWLSVRQPRELWQAILGGKVLVVGYLGAQGPAEATFDVAGADASQLPGWDR